MDDDRLVRRFLRAVLERDGFEVTELEEGRSLARDGASAYDLVCLDLGLADMPGLDVLKHLRASSPEVPVVVVTGDSDLESVVAAMRAGASDYVTKPVVGERLRLSLRHALERTALERRVVALRSELDGVRGSRNLIGESPPMKALVTSIQRVLASDVAVCILGESGTGKELVARAIHEEGRRAHGAFVAINCASIPDHLQESELFGHEKGAFTGATGTYHGRFEQADGGTLFLDELGDMSLATQVKLLRALQEKSIRRIGGTTDIRTNVRVIGATHRDLEEMVRRGAFREDLYFRLMVYPIEMPPLRDRKSDIPLLVARFMDRHRADVGRDVTRWSPEALDALMAYDWPGNVRELENLVHRAMLTCATERVELSDLPRTLRKPVLPPLASVLPPPTAPRVTGLPTLNLRELEGTAIKLALEQSGGHIANAAKLLGIGRATLYRRVVEIGVTADGGSPTKGEPPSSEES
ncbi:MAG TPA: sigma-54 dependent transcriptional regulator [Polyangiaceae bacterium]|nr:sigma-54 dependent transcriptional regulator [Polyangiaceae bacterium]